MNTHQIRPAFLIALTLVINLVQTPASADELDEASQDALKKTIELMNSPGLRETVLKDNKARAADRAAGLISGGNEDIKNDIYSLSSIVFERIVRESKGDTQKMNQLLMDAQRDPASFAVKFFPPGSPEAAKLKELEARARPKSLPNVPQARP